MVNQSPFGSLLRRGSLPDRMISCARRSPTRASELRAAAPGMIPSVTSVCANRACSAA